MKKVQRQGHCAKALHSCVEDGVIVTEFIVLCGQDQHAKIMFHWVSNEAALLSIIVGEAVVSGVIK